MDQSSKPLILIIMILTASSVFFAKMYSDQKKVTSEIVRIVDEHEVEEIKENAMWFKEGCESSINALSHSVPETSDGNFELSMMLYKSSCEEASKEVQKELLKLREKRAAAESQASKD